MNTKEMKEAREGRRKIYLRCVTREQMFELSAMLGMHLEKKAKEIFWPEKFLNLKRVTKKAKRRKQKEQRIEYKLWRGAPAYTQEQKAVFFKVAVYIKSEADVGLLQAKLGQKIHDTTNSLWYPKLVMAKMAHLEYVQKPEDTMGLKYSVYVISKGRWETPFTHEMLNSMKIKHKVVVEEVEYTRYCRAIGKENVLKAPFSNLGLGSIPVRNFVWDYSVSKGEEKHWIMDDNIFRLWRLQENERIKLKASNVFRFMEDFTDRFSNVAFAGPNYLAFSPSNEKLPPFYINTRVYSCILIRNNLDLRWRGRYNEDTDLCIRALKAGYATMLFNNFLIHKGPTNMLKGGNTDNIYVDGDRRFSFANSLKEQHPDVVQVTEKWGRYQHHVDYKPFKQNNPKPIIDIESLKEVDEYGIQLLPYIPEEKSEKKVQRISRKKKLTFGHPKF